MAECGRTVLKCIRHCSISTLASRKVLNTCMLVAVHRTHALPPTHKRPGNGNYRGPAMYGLPRGLASPSLPCPSKTLASGQPATAETPCVRTLPGAVPSRASRPHPYVPKAGVYQQTCRGLYQDLWGLYKEAEPGNTLWSQQFTTLVPRHLPGYTNTKSLISS